MTLKQMYRKFQSEKSCIAFLEKILWDNSPVCPYCKTENFSLMKNENRYHCNTCNMSFSVTVKTMFHDTRCDLQKWFYAIHLLSNPLKNLSEIKLGEEIETTKDTALLLKNKITKTKLTTPDQYEKIKDGINSTINIK
ncbi:MAG: transposase [Flavisolibacter sp.]